jgi:hypothetical protein
MKMDLVSIEIITLIRHLIQSLITIYLLLRFHPFHKKVVVLKGSDIDIIFASATFILFNLLVEIFGNYLDFIPFQNGVNPFRNVV